MAGTTPVYGLRYQELSDPPHGPNLGQQLALDVEDELVRLDGLLDASDYTAYVPTWKSGAGGTDMAIGNGSIAGFWTRLPNRLIHATIKIVRGSTTNVGTTYYAFGLPVAPADIAAISGTGEVLNGTTHLTRVCVGQSGSEIVLVDMAGAPVSSSAPVAWAAGHRISLSIVYRAAT
jgi:hypothetical protein